LCAGLGLLGKQILLIDMDPQSNSTSGLGVERHSLEASVYDMLVDEVDFEKCVIPTQWKGISVLPSTIDLAGAEIELVSVLSRETRLKRGLAYVTAYDYVFIDCPPSLGLLTLNSLVASDSVIIPIQCEYYALEGLSQLTRTIELVRSHLNASLSLDGLLLTMFDMRTRLSRDVADEVSARFQDKVFKTIIPRNVRISEAPSHGMPIQYYDTSSPGSTAYNNFAMEVMQKCQNNEV
jgi:chromosome partitioning protein